MSKAGGICKMRWYVLVMLNKIFIIKLFSFCEKWCIIGGNKGKTIYPMCKERILL